MAVPRFHEFSVFYRALGRLNTADTSWCGNISLRETLAPQISFMVNFSSLSPQPNEKKVFFNLILWFLWDKP